MTKYLKGHAALASLSIIAAAVAIDGTANANTAEEIISPSARAIQLAQAAPVAPRANTERLQVSPAARMITTNHAKYGKITVTPEAAAAFRALSPQMQAKLGDPKGGQAVNVSELASLRNKMSEGTVMCPW